MGVKGLWRLLLPIGRRISIETLEGKILAIDASIWLTQFLKAMRDPETGSVKPAAHLIGFFRRLAKLRYHGIRPVLVFDGATPEIKKREVQQRRRRREQFASTGQASMQRLAKRLLLEQLKKTKNGKKVTIENEGGAYAPGFQPADDEQVKTHEKQRDGADGEASKKPAAAENKDDSHEAIMAEVADLEEQWAIQASLEPENDFDNAVIDLTTQQEEKEEQPSIYRHTHDVFDVKRISSLPSHERKDAVEEAKRQQRMRSRREFMPVAGQMEEYSQAQLRNFLRSSRLNKQINEMAKAAAGNDNDGIGERMASDATRRIILTRDDDNEKDASKNPWKRLQKRASQFRTSKLPPEEEDDDEFEWEDGETAATKNTSSPGGTRAATARTRAFGEADSDDVDSDAERGGGFLTSSEKMPVSTTRPVPAIHINSDESDSEGVGGFMTVTPPSKKAPASETVIEIDDGDGGGGGFLPQPSADARQAQELEDEMLARALQETEESELVDTAAVARAPRMQQEGGEHSSKATVQIDRDAPLAAQLQHEEIVQQSALNGSDEDSDSIDWEDGDQGDGSGLDEESDKKIAATTGGRSPLVSPATPTRPTALSETPKKDDEENDSDDIAWEDVDEGMETVPDAVDAMKLQATASVEPALQKPSISQRFNGTTNGDRLLWEDDNIGKSGIEANDFDDVQIVDQNTEALEHAQETASHLTNWAGRAFRRAMAQHAEETGVGSPEKSSHNATIEPAEAAKDDRDDSSVEVLEAERQTSPPRKHAPAVSTKSPSERPPDPSPTRPPAQSGATAMSKGESASTTTQSFDLFQEETMSLQEQGDKFDAETRRKERDMDTITDEMKAEVIQLIQLFGIPYVESPAEAEAQCAKLEELGLVDGIVTEDSDVFVFGGKTIYKNIFDDQKYVEAYLANDAQRDLALNRNQFVALAMLLGGDYSEGVKGVGIVNGMEVLQAFDCSDSVKEGLSKFRAWMDGFDPDDARKTKSDSNEKLSAEQEFRRKHKTARTQWVAPQNFPADNVMNAYLKPVVDTSSEPFSWGTPDRERLLMFCQRSMGWEYDETRKLLEPVLQRLEDTSRQTRLESFFMREQDDIRFANVKSKRLRAVFDDIQKDQSTEGEDAQKKRARTKS
jgi:DNA excision repair protein ERCC-5